MKESINKDRSPTTFRLSDKLNAGLFEAAHIKRVSKNQFVHDALEAAVAKTLKEGK